MTGPAAEFEGLLLRDYQRPERAMFNAFSDTPMTGRAEHHGSSIIVTFDGPIPRDHNWIIHFPPVYGGTPCQAFADTGPVPSETWGWPDLINSYPPCEPYVASGFGWGRMPEEWLWDASLGLRPAPQPPAAALWGPSYAALTAGFAPLEDGWWYRDSARFTFREARDTISFWRDYVPPPPPPPRDRDWRRRGPPPRFAENRAGL